MLFTKLELALIGAETTLASALGLRSSPLAGIFEDEDDTNEETPSGSAASTVPTPTLVRDMSVWPNVARLMSIFMLSRAFRDVETLQSCLQSGRLTVIEGVPTDWLWEISLVLKGIVGSPGRCLIVSDLNKATRGLHGFSHAIVVEANEAGSAIDWTEKSSLIENAIASHVPLFVVCTKVDKVLPAPLASLVTHIAAGVEPTRPMFARLLRVQYGWDRRPLPVDLAPFDPSQLAAACAPHIDRRTALVRLEALGFPSDCSLE